MLPLIPPHELYELTDTVCSYGRLCRKKEVWRLAADGLFLTVFLAPPLAEIGSNTELQRQQINIF